MTDLAIENFRGSSQVTPARAATRPPDEMSFRMRMALLMGSWSLAVTGSMVGAAVCLGMQSPAIWNDMHRWVPALSVTGLVVTMLGILLTWHVAGRDALDASFVACDLDHRDQPVASFLDHGQMIAELSAKGRSLVKDPLTGLLNHSAFMTFVEDAVPCFHRYGRGVGLLLVEINRFEDIKHRFGEGGAEQVLRHIADVLDLSVRKTDKVARFGPSHFSVLLREISEADAMGLAGRIHAAISDLQVRNGDQTIAATVSIGAAIVSEIDRQSETLIQRTQTALEAAKAGGHDGVRFQTA